MSPSGASSNVCVVIPAHNASSTIAAVVRGAAARVDHVIVVDDGSTDDTGEVAKAAGAQVARVTPNKGKGHALKLLFQLAAGLGYDVVISMDADGQHDPEDISEFLAARARYPDCIFVGTRMRDTASIPRARYNSMHIARFYISLAANQFVEDTQCGFRLYPLSILRRLDLLTERYVTETEVLIKAGDLGEIIRFVKVKTIYEGGVSHFRPITDVTLIAAYVVSYLHIKWFIEGVTSNNPYTYAGGRRPRDVVSRHTVVDRVFRFVGAFTALPATVIFLLEYWLLPPVVPGNFASVRRLDCGFVRITFATLMLPIVLAIAVGEKVAGLAGLRLTLLDSVISACFPNLWSKAAPAA